MHAPTIVALTGIDGSGKSTAAQLVAAQLAAAGVAARYFRNPGGRVRVGRIARALGRRDGIHLLGRYGNLLVEAAVRWLAIARGVIWSVATGGIAVMDRYTVCQYAVMGARGDRGGALVRRCYAVFPPPLVGTFLAVDPRLARQRVRVRGYDDEDVDYLRSLDAAYRALPEFAGLTVIDASRPPGEVAAAIMALVPAGRRVAGVGVPVGPR